MESIKILYVEDEPFLGKIVRESLESRGFKVSMVEDGAEVLDNFITFHPDICVLDVMLPNKDGFTVAKEIKKVDASMPIIFLTAKNQTEDLLQGFKSGGNDYIKKPFSMEELIVRIQNLLSIAAKNIQNSIHQKEINIGKFSFYPEEMKLSLDDFEQNLSHRENELLKIFVQHKGETIDRKKILLDVWGDDSFFNSRNLDVYIKKLRNFLDADPSVQIITLKGVGYRFLC
jgi:DNA-binding response OmpR family regulator